MSLQQIIASLEKKYGITIGHLDESQHTIDVPVIPTGILSLDIALGVGGIPRGYFTEIFAPEGVGKTTLALQVVASAQRLGLNTSYIDMEHRLDLVWAKTLGVDLSKMYFTQPEYGEAALNIARELIKSAEMSLVVIDSVPALIPRAESDGEPGDHFVGLLPRLLAQGIRQMVHEMKKNQAAVIFINQIRARIGGMGSLAMGAQQTQPGGYALKHNASIRLDMRRIKTLKDSSGESQGQVVKVTTKKNSLGTPYKDAEIILNHGIGFDPIEDVINLAIVHGFIDQSGSWYTVGDAKTQGRKGVYELLRTDKDLYASLDNRIREVMLHGGAQVDIEDEDAAGSNQ